MTIDPEATSTPIKTPPARSSDSLSIIKTSPIATKQSMSSAQRRTVRKDRMATCEEAVSCLICSNTLNILWSAMKNGMDAI